MSNPWKLKELVQDFIAKGANSVEEIHKAIAAMPFDVLEKIAPVAPVAKSVRKVHDNTVGGVYNLIRKINEEAGKLAEELLDKADTVKKDQGENY